MRVSLFVTCLTDAYFPRAAVAAVKVIEHLGHEVDFPAAQTCCGQPMFNNGFEPQARDLASRMIDVFEASDVVVTPSGSCAAMIREHYVGLFAGDPVGTARASALAAKTHEFAEFLVKVLRVDLRTLGAATAETVSVHSACHLRGLGLVGVAESLLTQIDGLSVKPLERSEQCCGFGGTFAVKYPQISGGMVDDKVAAIKASGCGTVVCSEAGCCMNIAGACRRAGSSARFLSVAEVIAESLGLLPAAGVDA